MTIEKIKKVKIPMKSDSTKQKAPQRETKQILSQGKDTTHTQDNGHFQFTKCLQTKNSQKY